MAEAVNVQRQVLVSSPALQSGPPSVASTSARAPDEVGVSSNAVAAVSIAASVGVAPPGEFALINASAAGTQEFATAAAEMHQTAETLNRIVGGFTIETSARHRSLSVRPEQPDTSLFANPVAA